MRYYGTLINIMMMIIRAVGFVFWKLGKTMREVGVKSQGGVASINLFPNANVASAWHLHFFLPYFFLLCLCLLLMFSLLFSYPIPRKSFSRANRNVAAANSNFLWRSREFVIFSLRLLIHHWIIALFPGIPSTISFPFVYWITFWGFIRAGVCLCIQMIKKGLPIFGANSIHNSVNVDGLKYLRISTHYVYEMFKRICQGCDLYQMVMFFVRRDDTCH